jgi:hypothetical protein
MINNKSYVCANKECEYTISIHTDVSNENSFRPKKCPKCKGTEFTERAHTPKD